MSDIRTAVDVAAPLNNAPIPSTAPLHAKFRKRLQSRGNEFLLDVAIDATSGFTILFGASGAGKTTLLDCLAGLTSPDSGRISLTDRVLFDSSLRVNVPTAQRRVGYVFQTLALFPHMTVEGNVAYGLAHLPLAERFGRATSLLETFRISQLAGRKARDISGGESQRVALARTLVTDPEFLLLDEPLAALDAPTKGKIIDDLREWNRTHNIPILYVTHSREEAFALGERLIVLESGNVVAQGTPHEVLSAPYLETVAQLAGFENIFDAVVEAVRPERGTMTCRIAGDAGGVVLETPLVRGGVGSTLRIGIRAGDILLATSPPTGLSARNVIPGHIQSLEQRDVIVSARVRCRIEMEVHLTLAARDSLELTPGKEVWLVIKTHSCHLMQG
ncbi:MAG: molybdenum ABC transporter ATP-binding protein [Acidobacteriia bacterium]|nr:molybdenum ABC transporter ATP-binding protein [Terriglobia bacterium]